jgi:hypothetical protein
VSLSDAQRSHIVELRLKNAGQIVAEVKSLLQAS